MSAQRVRGSCADLEPAEADLMFFGRAFQEIARRMCLECPAASSCLTLALEAEGQDPAAYRYGIYAATTGAERAKAVRP